MGTKEDLTLELISKAETGRHRPFYFLRTGQEYLEARKMRRAHILLVASIKKSADKLFTKYCKSVTTGEADVLKLLAYGTIMKVLRFYEEELRIISDMVEEYEFYIVSGNWWDILFDMPRPMDKLWDHRSL